MSRLIDADALWMDVIHAMDYCEDILEIIEKQPTVEERKVGTWRAFKIGECDLIECTACKVARPREEMPTRNGGKIAWKYCPECGAKMEGGNDE